MRRRDNSSNNNNQIENYHPDGHYQEFLNLSSCSTVDSVVGKRHTFSMNNLLDLVGQFYNYLAQTEKKFNDTAKQIKNSKQQSQNQQSQTIQTLNKIKEQNTKDRAGYLKKINKELENCQKREKELFKIPVFVKIMVYEFHQNQIIRQVIEYFNTQKRNELLILQKYYLKNFKEKIKLQNKIEFYKDLSNISQSPSKSQQFKSENIIALSSQVVKFENVVPEAMTFNKLKITEENINQNQYSIKSGIQGREEQHQLKVRVEPKTNSTKFQKSFFNQKKKGKKD